MDGKDKKKILFFPSLVVLAGAIILIAAFFLPYASATKEWKEFLTETSGEKYLEGSDMENQELINISLLEYTKLYSTLGATLELGKFGYIYVALFAAVGVCSFLVLIFAIFKKAIPVMVFDLLTFGTNYLLFGDFKDRGIMSGSNYHTGVGCYLYFAVTVVVFLGAVWLLITKIRIQKALVRQNPTRF